MKTLKIYTIAILIAALGSTTYYLTGPSRFELVSSSTGCCTYLIDNTAKEFSYTSVERQETNSFDTLEEREELREYYMEYCYDNHPNQETR